MGYHTDFEGSFSLNKPLTPEHKAYLRAFAEVRHVSREPEIIANTPDPVREAAGLSAIPEYYVGSASEKSQPFNDDMTGLVDFNEPPKGVPGLWCDWLPNEDGTVIQWNGQEKFYDYVPWISYIVDHFLKPWGYILNGEVEYIGEESDDHGYIILRDNVVHVDSYEYRYRMKIRDEVIAEMKDSNEKAISRRDKIFSQAHRVADILGYLYGASDGCSIYDYKDSVLSIRMIYIDKTRTSRTQIAYKKPGILSRSTKVFEMTRQWDSEYDKVDNTTIRIDRTGDWEKHLETLFAKAQELKWAPV